MARLANALTEMGRIIRRIIGAPDYELYVAHLSRAHPGIAPMSESDFVRGQMEGRGRPGARCC